MDVGKLNKIYTVIRTPDQKCPDTIWIISLIILVVPENTEVVIKFTQIQW